MNHFIIYKQKGKYASFPLIDKKEDRLCVSCFVSSKIDHFGKEEYHIYSTSDYNTWKQEEKYIQAKYISNRDKNDRIVIGNKEISIPFFKDKKFVNRIIIRDIDLKFPYTNNIKEIGIPGLKALVGFPRGIITKRYAYLPAYGIICNNQNIPFLIRYDYHRNYCDVIQMFNNPYIQLNEYALINQDDVLIALFRQEKMNWLVKSFSYDFGKTWSYPEYVHIYGYPPHLLRLDENEILCTYGYRMNPMGIKAIKINNNCDNISKEIILREDGGYYSELDKIWNRNKNRQWHTGYPVSIKLNEDEILTVYYITCEDHITHIAGTRWSLSEMFYS